VALNPKRGRLPATCKSFHLSPSWPSFSRPFRYVTGSSRETRQPFQEAHPEVTHVRTLFHEWLRTVYSTSFTVDSSSFLTLISGDEEKMKRTSHNAVSVVSITAPNHMDMDTTADDHTVSPSAVNIPSSPPSGATPQTPTTPAPSPTVGSSADRLIPENDSGSRSEIPSPSQTPPSFHDEAGNNPPPALPPPIHSQTESPIPPRSSTPTPGAVLAPPLLVCAESGAFDLTGVHGGFISKDTRIYWESVPGGARWVELVKSYLKLETIPLVKGVSSTLTHALSSKLMITSSKTRALRQRIDQKSYKFG
jgi:hypothetical protein